MKPDKKTVLQQLKDSTVILDLEDLRTVMHEILEEYQESHAKHNEEYLSIEEVIEILPYLKKDSSEVSPREQDSIYPWRKKNLCEAF